MVLHWLQTHGLVKSQQCDSCRQAFASAELLQVHRQRQHYPWGSNPGQGPRYLCNHCDGLLDSRDELGVHLRSVHAITHLL